MISSEAQRTLVKSPPELWAELSDPAALAQHLSELGEVRVIGTKPERTVEWEASSASGKIELSPSGWGTKVKLSLQRQPAPAQEQEQEQELEASASPHDPADPEPAELEATSEPHMDEPAIPRAPRFRFFARLFRRRRSELPAAEAADPTPPQQDAPSEPPPPAAMPMIERQEAPSALSTELQSVEEALLAADTQLLNGILDRLGAAHHRPFSRA